jgi:hypothetical protein
MNFNLLNADRLKLAKQPIVFTNVQLSRRLEKNRDEQGEHWTKMKIRGAN